MSLFDITKFPKFHVYCDESSQTQHRYLVIGSIFCASSTARQIQGKINLITNSFNCESELKWSKITRLREQMYTDIFAEISQLIATNYLQFNAIVVDTTKVNYKQHNGGDRDLGFTKFLFTLLYKYARVHKGNLRFYIFLDSRTTQHTPDKLKQVLNSKVKKELALGFAPYRTVEFCDSKASRLIQISDLLTGLIAYDSNSHHTKTGASPHKKRIAEKCREMFNVNSFSQPTSYGRGDGFDIWHLDFGAKREKAART